jgi:predicted dehydrogenase
VSVSIAVVGAGFMGSNHARVLSSLPDATLSLVVDQNEERARQVAGEFDCDWGQSLDDAEGRAQAVIVATPTETHRELALQALEMGFHVLVEKPFALSVEEAAELVAAADRTGRLLAVGHVERFNPACLDIPRFLTTPLFIQTRRLSPYNERIHDGVVRDMMIHDIDLVLSLEGSRPTRVTADVCAIRSDTEDIATATVVFESGLVAQMTATRIGQDKVRRVDIVQTDSVLNVDLMRQDITIRRQATDEYPETGARRLKESQVIEIPYLEHRGEPLWLELKDFVDAVGSDRPPLVDGRAGLAALDLCERILAAAGAA